MPTQAMTNSRIVQGETAAWAAVPKCETIVKSMKPSNMRDMVMPIIGAASVSSSMVGLRCDTEDNEVCAADTGITSRTPQLGRATKQTNKKPRRFKLARVRIFCKASLRGG